MPCENVPCLFRIGHQPYIVGGENADEAEFPHQVSRRCLPVATQFPEMQLYLDPIVNFKFLPRNPDLKYYFPNPGYVFKFDPIPTRVYFILSTIF